MASTCLRIYYDLNNVYFVMKNKNMILNDFYLVTFKLKAMLWY